MTMVKLAPVTLVRPHPARWLVPGVNCTQLEYDVVVRAMEDDGIMESHDSHGVWNNRGVSIDKWLRAAGVPESLITSGKGYWCAAWAGAVYRDVGCLVPRDYAATRSWAPYLEDTPRIGSAILYGLRQGGGIFPHHIGIVTRLPSMGMLVTIEGNRGYAGTANNGVAVDQGPPARKDILGYIHARAA